MASIMADKTRISPDWHIVSPIGPVVAYHASCVLNNRIYLHGGIDKKGSTKPLNKMWCMDLDATIWTEVNVENSPSLSHHACVTLADRYIVIIGKCRPNVTHYFVGETLNLHLVKILFVVYSLVDNFPFFRGLEWKTSNK